MSSQVVLKFHRKELCLKEQKNKIKPTFWQPWSRKHHVTIAWYKMEQTFGRSVSFRSVGQDCSIFHPKINYTFQSIFRRLLPWLFSLIKIRSHAGVTRLGDFQSFCSGLANIHIKVAQRYIDFFDYFGSITFKAKTVTVSFWVTFGRN